MKNCMHIVFVIYSLVLFASQSYSQGLEIYDQTKSYPGYTLFPSGDKAYLIDNCGKIINEWTASSASRLATYLMPNGNLFWMGALAANTTFQAGGGGGGLLEIYDNAGNLVWTYSYYAANQLVCHHDCTILPNGNILLVLWEQQSLSEAIAIGRNPANLPSSNLWTLGIVEIEPVGSNQINTVWEWHLTDHVIQNYNSNIANFGVVADNPQLIDINVGGFGTDWIHTNGIDYNPQLDQIIFSSRNLDEIYIIDHSTTTAEAAAHSGGLYGKGGDLLYRWGNPQNYDRGSSSDHILFGQHDCRWVRKGFVNEDKISIFNNFGNSPSSSIEIITPPTDSLGFYTMPLNNTTPFGPAITDFTYTNGPDGSFSSSNQGATQVLPNGNIMVNSTNQGYIFEIDALSNTVVWQYLIPGVPNTFKAVRYLANDIELDNYDLSMPGSTIEMPSSQISQNCSGITYPFFCVFNFSGTDALSGSEFSAKADYETDGLIESTQIIEPFAIVDYDSATEITLLPGFEVKLNADFFAIIDGCDNGNGGLN